MDLSQLESLGEIAGIGDPPTMKTDLMAKAMRNLAAAFHELATAIEAQERRPTKAHKGPRPNSKTFKAVELTRRPEGASDKELVQVTGWTGGPSSWRPWFVRADGKGHAQRFGYTYTSAMVNGEVRHFLTDDGSPDLP